MAIAFCCGPCCGPPLFWYSRPAYVKHRRSIVRGPNNATWRNLAILATFFRSSPPYKSLIAGTRTIQNPEFRFLFLFRFLFRFRLGGHFQDRIGRASENVLRAQRRENPGRRGRPVNSSPTGGTGRYAGSSDWINFASGRVRRIARSSAAM